MINLLYHSHTLVPAHLEELLGLSLLEHDEQVLVAFDGVLVDGQGVRLSGPTLHDYCLITSLRVLLWARDYGNHLCYAFPLAELALVDGAGLDPLHAQVDMVFAAPGEEEQQFTLTLLPLNDLQAAIALLRIAGDTARQMATAGLPRHEAGPEMGAVLSEQIFGSAEGLRPGSAPYRWPGASAPPPIAPGPAYQQNPASLPPEPMYAAGRLARSAWDTLRRSLQNAELPFDLNSGSLRELTDAVRAINDLVQTMSTNPAAQEMAMAFLNRKQEGAAEKASAARTDQATSSLGSKQQANGPFAEQPSPRREEPAQAAQSPEQAPVYREIPLRRRGEAAPTPLAPVPPPAVATSERGAIPLRRRAGSSGPLPGRAPAPMSGSGDANVES